MVVGRDGFVDEKLKAVGSLALPRQLLASNAGSLAVFDGDAHVHLAGVAHEHENPLLKRFV